MSPDQTSAVAGNRPLLQPAPPVLLDLGFSLTADIACASEIIDAGVVIRHIASRNAAKRCRIDGGTSGTCGMSIGTVGRSGWHHSAWACQ